ncbi:MAG: flagellin [Bacteroidota bacterium]
MAFGDLNRINTNLQSLDAQFSLNKINKNLAETQLRLSTGKRINKAEDDAAGFSIAAKLSSRIAGLEQALKNTGDAKSVLDIAESSFNNILDILNEVKTKVTQAANDTYGDDERSFIQDQITALRGEIDDLVSQTLYQGTKLLDGNYDATFQVGETSSDTIRVQIETDSSNGFDATGLNIQNSDITVDTATNANTSLDAVDNAITQVAKAVNGLGIDQTKLSIREENLTQAINSNSAARSRIEDADFAKEQSSAVKLQILQQTAISALAQANAAPQAVLGFVQQ